MKKKKLFVLSCGTNACFNLIKTGHELFNSQLEIYGADTNKPEFVACYPYLSGFYQTLDNHSPNYYNQIIRILTDLQPDFLLPSFDRDQILFNPANQELIKLGIISLGTGLPLLSHYSDKNEMNNFLSENNFEIPKIFSLDQIEKDKEYFVKPIDGVGSVGAMKMKGEIILKKDLTTHFIIQELCEKPEVTVECFHEGDFFSSICRERCTTKSGVANKARIFMDDELLRIVKRFSKISGVPRIFNLQFMKSKTGHWKITDVNLRMAGGGHLSVASGWNSYEAICRSLISPNSSYETALKLPQCEQFVCTVQDNIITKRVKHKLAFDLDGTLLDSRARHTLVLNAVLNEMNLPIDTSKLMFMKRIGCSTFDFLSSSGLSSKEASAVNSQWIKRIEEAQFQIYDKLYEGIRELLQRLYLNNDIYLITARKDQKELNYQLERLSIFQYFKKVIVVNPSDSSTEKSIFLERLVPDIFIGDTESDEKAAKLANVKFYPVNYGFRSDRYWSDRKIKSHSKEELFSFMVNYENNK